MIRSKWCKALACPASPTAVREANGVRTETYGPVGDGTEVIFIIVDGLGHTWPGGRSILPERLVGKMSDKVNATDTIWAFFQRHPMK